MARFVFDGKYKIYALAAKVADPAAPKLTELGAGVEITAFVAKDGFKPGVSNARVAGGDLSTVFAAESMGTFGSQLSIDCYLDDVAANNIAYNLIGVRGFTGSIVVVPSGPAAVGKTAYVWPDVEAGTPVPMNTATNERQKFVAELAVRAQPNFNAALVA